LEDRILELGSMACVLYRRDVKINVWKYMSTIHIGLYAVFGKKLHHLKLVFLNYQILERGFVLRSNMAILDHQSLNPGLSVDLGLETKSTGSWDRNVKIDFRTVLLDLVQKTCLVRFSHQLRLSNFRKAPQDMRKFPQKCHKIAKCWKCAVYDSQPPIALNLAHLLKRWYGGVMRQILVDS